MKFFQIAIILFGFLLSGLTHLRAWEECTIGAASAKATGDGRPMIWKTRDNSSARDNELVYNTSYSIPFLEVTSAGKTYAWMGLNRDGFAIVNSVASDLPVGDTGLSNGALMRNALGACSSIAEFESYLNQNDHGKTRGNFAVLDSSGTAAIFEIGGNQYWKFSADDSIQAPYGYLIRTNFAANGNGVDGSGYERFNRSAKLIYDFYSGDSLNYKSILRYQMRDFSDSDSNPVSVPYPDNWYSYRPYGYIYTNVSINRASSVSAAVIQGVLSGESEKLSTMWTILGSPAAAIAVPYWPVGSTPSEANGSSTAPLCDLSLQIRAQLYDYSENGNYIDSYKLLDGSGGGLWSELFPVEDSILTACENWLEKWRAEGLNSAEMLSVEKIYAQYAYHALEDAYSDLTTEIETDEPAAISGFELYQNYPNPFNPSTNISYRLASPATIQLHIYNIEGKEVHTLLSQKQAAGRHRIRWNVAIAGKLSSGLYFCRLTIQTEKNSYSRTIKMNYIK